MAFVEKKIVVSCVNVFVSQALFALAVDHVQIIKLYSIKYYIVTSIHRSVRSNPLRLSIYHARS